MSSQHLTDAEAYLRFVHTPLVLAPMAGGVGSVELAVAVSRAHAFVFLAAGYLDVPDLAARVDAFVERSPGGYGVNLFVGDPLDVPVPAALAAFRDALLPAADKLGVQLPSLESVLATRADDWLGDKIDYLVAHPVPAVSFTFGLPEPAASEALRRAGTALIATVTNPAEAVLALDAGFDLLCVQSAAAGGHRGTFGNYQGSTLELPLLLDAVRDVGPATLIAAGGVSGPADVAELLRRGVAGVQVGTAFLAADESGAPEAHKTALTAPGATTAVTRAFTGRPARGIVNDFMREYGELAPPHYPQVHALTSGLRKAAGAAGQDWAMSLWAGTGHRHARRKPGEQIARDLLAGL